MILVTGASGFIGLHLVRALVAGGHEVRALVRSTAGAERVRVAAQERGGTVDVVHGDVTDARGLGRAAEGCHLVYHLAGTYRGSPADLHESHVTGTANLLEALDPGARVVYLSSTSVYGWEGPWPVDHATAPRPVSAYGTAKLEAEKLVLGRGERQAVVVRPTIVYGPGDLNGMLARAARLMRRGVRRFPGSGTNRVDLLHVDDLVVALGQLGQAESEGVFLLGGPEAAPLERILTLLADGAGLRRPDFGLPAPALRQAAAVLEAAWAAVGLGGEPPLSRHAIDVATKDRTYSWARAAAELGWSPKVPLEDGVPAAGAWLADRLRHGAGAEGRKPATDGSGPGHSIGFDWRSYFDDPDEGLGTVYERFALARVLDSAIERTGARSVLHAPLFGMMGIPGLDAVFQARAGIRVGLLDFDAERLEAVRSLWAELELYPETHLVEGSDPRAWPAQLGADYDLVFSFAALWWFDDPWGVLAASARWAQRGVLACVPNRNVFLRTRARLWHRDLFAHLSEEAIDRVAMHRAAEEIGLVSVDEGLFDIPPFPDTSVPLAKVVRALLRRQPGGPPAEAAPEGVWRWSILPHLKGEDASLEDRVERLGVLERHLPGGLAPHLAHHRYTLFVPGRGSPAPVGAGAAAHST